MFHYQKKRIAPFLFAFFCSLLIHLPLFISYKIPFFSYKSSFLQTENNNKDFILVDYPIHQQIVSQEEFNKITPKRQTSYLSKEDKTVDQETQAMLNGLFHQADQHKRLKNRQFSKSVDRNISSRESSLADKITAPISVDLSAIESENVFQETDSRALSRTMDFLPRVEFGSHTLLNTREFIYYSYFARMKEQLYWRWTQYIKKELLERAFSFNKFVNEYKSRYFSTSLYVYLSPEGEVQDMRVVKSSGVEDIDSAALHAFLLAEPFPNPPRGLIEEDGYIHIKQMFHLSIAPFLSQNLFSRQE